MVQIKTPEPRTIYMESEPRTRDTGADNADLGSVAGLRPVRTTAHVSTLVQYTEPGAVFWDTPYVSLWLRFSDPLRVMHDAS